MVEILFGERSKLHGCLFLVLIPGLHVSVPTVPIIWFVHTCLGVGQRREPASPSPLICCKVAQQTLQNPVLHTWFLMRLTDCPTLGQ